MESIQTSSLPLLFKSAATDEFRAPPPGPDYPINIRVNARRLIGTQQQALVVYGPSPTVWQLTGDAGPDLDGTDLAPSPLAFFSAGLAASCLSQLLTLARHRYLRLGSPSLHLDTVYRVQPSAPTGALTAAALPARVSCRAESDATDEELCDLLLTAIAGCPAEALLGGARRGAFSLTRNRTRLEVAGVLRSAAPTPADPAPLFGCARPAEVSSYVAGGIERRQAGEIIFGVEGGARSSLDITRKQEARVRASATVRHNGLKCIDVRIVKPIGGVFRFLSDDSAITGGQERAPSGLALMSTGLALCYLTQVDRCARVLERELTGCRLIQDLAFSLPASPRQGQPTVSGTAPDTHVYVDSDEPDEVLRELIRQAEQGSPLHAACRASNPTQVDRESACPR